LLVALDDLGPPEIGVVGVTARFAERAPLSQQVPGLVERDLERVESGAWTEPSPIGFYFAKLWYYERLYPLIWTVSAMGRVAALG